MANKTKTKTFALAKQFSNYLHKKPLIISLLLSFNNFRLLAIISIMLYR